ncbi:hypothetical protein AGDE_02211 [Angomonas deanei]|uniref:Dpy-30 motif containing protein, putative n=1 Tax=Angomonas deanei TaxID=59799 RepID=A0A7G2CQB3_9TRYP|nr:hypothetical protein AGDE_02211 [Angomonas deanei]CAD2222046.1 Dpy-30 motif containing protein, putative [Angomonas deanei]|eukprot:EPY41713.1 hypothetical protein AGDE_02211 [Angomonas deanei]
MESSAANDQPPSSEEPTVPVQQYLEDTVMSTLAEGLEDLCRVRPANPVDYLALYLLRRSQSSTVVEVPISAAQPIVTAQKEV